MPATLTAQRTTVSVEKLLEVIVGLVSEVMGGRDTEHLRLRIAIWRVRGEPNWQARIATPRPRSWRRSSMRWTMPPSVTISMMILSIMRLLANWRLKT